MATASALLTPTLITVIEPLWYWTTPPPTATYVPGTRCVLDSAICTPPCWEGIVPGKTGRHTALELLAASRLVVENTLAEVTIDGDRLALEWRDPGMIGHMQSYLLDVGGAGHSAIVKDSVLEEIFLLINPDLCKLSAETVVRQYGDPEAVLFSSWDGALGPSLQVTLLYPSQGIVAGVRAGLPPQREDPVGVMLYIQPQSLDELSRQPGWEPWMKTRVEWHGFAGDSE